MRLTCTVHRAKLAPLPFSLLSPPSQPVVLAKTPAHSCLTLGFLAFSWRWSNPSEEYWTSHYIQTSFFLYYFISFYLFIYFYLVYIIQPLVPILLRLHPVHSLSVKGVTNLLCKLLNILNVCTLTTENSRVQNEFIIYPA